MATLSCLLCQLLQWLLIRLRIKLRSQSWHDPGPKDKWKKKKNNQDWIMIESKIQKWRHRKKWPRRYKKWSQTTLDYPFFTSLENHNEQNDPDGQENLFLPMFKMAGPSGQPVLVHCPWTASEIEKVSYQLPNLREVRGLKFAEEWHRFCIEF